MNQLRFPRGLYGVTPDWDDTARLLAAIAQAQAGGMVALQLRRKHASAAARLEQALRVRDLCARLSLVLIINDDWRLALSVAADGVHVGRDDADLVSVRAELGPTKIIGCSCYDQVPLAQRQMQAGADYVALGSMYPSAIKPAAVRASLAHVTAARALAQAYPGPRPAICAIGGLSPDNAGVVVEAGADSIAVISALFEAPDIQAAAAGCVALFN